MPARRFCNVAFQIAVHALCSVALTLPIGSAYAGEMLRVETDSQRPGVVLLGLDTEGGDRARINILRDSAQWRLRRGGAWETQASGDVAQRDAAETVYRTGNGDSGCSWRVKTGADTLDMSFERGAASTCDAMALVFPLAPKTVATTVLPHRWHADGRFELPVILSAPDLGQLLITCSQREGVSGTLRGDRTQHTVDVTLEFTFGTSTAVHLHGSPVVLSMPQGLREPGDWAKARRGWFNLFEPSAAWGDPANTSSAPSGILSNNVISDPVSCLIHLYADHALFVPELAPGVAATEQVRNTIEWWLDNKIKPDGEMIAYTRFAGMLDANASPVIAAWDLVEATHDRAWLAGYLGQLERIADYLVQRDKDRDGLVESTHSGIAGTLNGSIRGGSAYDTINAGYKDAYSNVLAYRAFRCIADLERQAGRAEQSQGYAAQADRLKAVFFKTFYNPQTGWLAWWLSEDGELHDLSTPMISSLAIEYGLVEREDAKAILNKLWDKIVAVGFTNFALGVPLTLAPVRKTDYTMPNDQGKPQPGMYGVPARDDGSDTFGQYLNGGCCVSDTVYFLTALYMVGEDAKADRILDAMLDRQSRGVFPNGGGFQNGVVNRYPDGAEFFTWDGKTCGYEGHLTYSWSFLQAIFLREPEYRDRLLRPLHAVGGRE